jgi:hypothetical protein
VGWESADSSSMDRGALPTDNLRVRRVVAGLLAWTLFVSAWSLALDRGAGGAAGGTAVLLLSALVAVVLTAAWQLHNKSIYRRKGVRRTRPLDRRRRGRHETGPRPRVDGDLLVASEVVVTLSATGAKTYRAEP